MVKAKIAITLDKQSIGDLDKLVEKEIFQNRSQAIQEAINEKLMRLKKIRLITESLKLKRVSERKLSEEGLVADGTEWPEY